MAAEWTVPQAQAEAQFGNYSSAATWAGLGGNGSGSLLWQAATVEYTHSVLWFQTSGYYAGWELAPNISAQQISMNVDNGDDVEAEVWVCDPTQSYATTGPGSPNAALCAWIHNYTKNQDWTLESYASTASLKATTAFQTAEVIQEWDSNGNSDYAQFDKFAFRHTGVCSTANTWGNCLGAKTHLNPFGQMWEVYQDGWDGYVTTMLQIGSPSHTQGGSCMGDASGNCDNGGGNSDPLVWVWWNSHE